MLFPLLSEADPALTSEGTIDPLGLYAIADSLAVRLIPGVRERQTHPRFLTAIAVSLAVCSEFDEETVAADRVSEPWQVFEWYAVEGLVRTIKDPDKLRGLPGREKATRAIHGGVPLAANRYLKTPSVFGFHGVYRLLSRTLGIELSSRLGEFGYELLPVWADEQGLTGFQGSAGGRGADWRKKICEAVSDGLKQGAVARASGWGGWGFFTRHLAHLDIGKNEAKTIQRGLLDGADGFRGPVLDFLISEEGRSIVEDSLANDAKISERAFHASLRKTCSASLQALLDTIMAYETFSRLLQDAFDDCLFRMSQARDKAHPKELAELKGVKEASQKIPGLFTELVEALFSFEESLRFQETFEGISEPMPPRDWIERLLEHHRTVQRKKPPLGKAPWFERLDDGRCMLRPGYLRDKGGKHDREYVHGYRTTSLWSFARDLGLLT